MAINGSLGGDFTLIYSNVPENDYPEYSATVTYAMGQMVIVSSRHEIFRSAANSNTGNSVDSPAFWIPQGTTNRYKCHDTKIGTHTKHPNRIHNQYKIKGLCNTVAALNVVASSMQVRMFDINDGVVYDRSYSLITNTEMNDWYDYFFGNVSVLATDLILNDLPHYANAIVEVIVNSLGNDVEVGEIVMGHAVKLGATQYGAKVGIQDYSQKNTDSFGNQSVNERPYRKTGDFQVFVSNDAVDSLQILLAQYRAKPVLYLGSDAFASTAIYGFYRDFDITVAYPTNSLCSISIEGLT